MGMASIITPLKSQVTRMPFGIQKPKGPMPNCITTISHLTSTVIKVTNPKLINKPTTMATGIISTTVIQVIMSTVGLQTNHLPEVGASATS